MKTDSAIGRFVERHRALRIGVTVFTRTAELNGTYAANAVTLIAFVSLFPLALLIVSVLGLLTGSNPDLGTDIVDALGLTGRSVDLVIETLERAQRSGAAGSIVGVAGFAWTGLSLVGALRFAVNLPHGTAVSGLRARILGIPWLVGAGAIMAASIAVSAVLQWLPGWTAPFSVLVSLAVSVGLFTWTFWFLDVERPDPRLLLPGAVAAAVGFEVLKWVGTAVLPRLLAGSSATYGALGTVFAILTWLLIFSRILVYSVVLNAVVAEARGEGSGPDAAEVASGLGDPSEHPE